MTAQIIQFVPRTRTPTLMEAEELKTAEFLKRAPQLIVATSDWNEIISCLLAASAPDNLV